MNKGVTFDRDLLSPDEIDLMLDELIQGFKLDTMYLAMFVLMYRCGLRVSEVIGDRAKPEKGLRVKDIDLDRATVRVNHGKGDKSALLGMDERTCQIVSEWISEREDMIADQRMIESDRLFTTKYGKIIAHSAVDKKLKNLAAKVGIKKRVHVHGLRDAFAVGLMDEGVHPMQIMKTLRHADLKTTMRYLDHLNPEDVVNTMQGREW